MCHVKSSPVRIVANGIASLFLSIFEMENYYFLLTPKMETVFSLSIIFIVLYTIFIVHSSSKCNMFTILFYYPSRYLRRDVPHLVRSVRIIRLA